MAQTMQRGTKFILLTSLYTSQFLPSAFFFRGLPIFMRQQDTSLEVIGLLGFLTLPWMLKFLWAPLVDLYGSKKWGHYKSWIVATQSLLASVLVICSNIDVSENAALLFGGVFVIVTLAATQDIATDALAFNLLAPSERGWGNGIQSAGRAVGGIIGGGVMLLILNQLGWHLSLWILAATVLLALFPLLRYQENENYSSPKETPSAAYHTLKTPAYFQTLLSFFRRPGVLPWLLFIWLYVTGNSIASSMFRPLLVDVDLSLSEIGWMVGIVGSGAAIIGSFVAGGLIQPLGRRRSLVIFALFQAMAVLALILPAIGITHQAVLYTVSSGELFARSLTSTALFTVMMDKSRGESAGSDYTLQSSAYMIGHHIGMPAFSGFMASSVGYTGVFSMSFLFCLLGAWLATKVKCD
ncbi:major facilitator superfamily MFS_1 [Halothece sp. PCC 7418]|uniref:MFS transporter n=1 Tax=Halothece sp. (strain PCC 7418) TaxID=65093 RepID=UPI0002A088E6|nr:MFS transporter [Halothece sp. PCC 7418]AFZ42415.1 major facilitator superfamily MFS_1 [Halothece sp. PCC 7418]